MAENNKTNDHYQDFSAQNALNQCQTTPIPSDDLFKHPITQLHNFPIEYQSPHSLKPHLQEFTRMYPHECWENTD